jgi:hypothetical protein
MNFRPSKWIVTPLLFIGAVGFFQACGSDDGGDSGSSPTVTITAPGIVSPTSGSQVGETRPTLTVSNATASNGATPTYTFQVASDSSFNTMIVQQGGISQGSGQTSWQVTQDLPSLQYFWRARGDVSGTQGPWSSTADFTVTGGVQPGDIVVINDPLTNGGSAQAIARGGGTFTDRGWRVDTNQDFLRYEVNSISNGFVQWNNVGLTPRGATADSHMLFAMWDPSAGGFRANAFRVNIQKLWGPTHNPPWLRFRWISAGRLQDGASNFNSWDPGTVYTWRVQWGPAEGAHTAKVFLDGVEMMQVRYNRAYQPNTHWIEFGIQERGESVIDAIYSNIVIGRRQ